MLTACTPVMLQNVAQFSVNREELMVCSVVTASACFEDARGEILLRQQLLRDITSPAQDGSYDVVLCKGKKGNFEGRKGEKRWWMVTLKHGVGPGYGVSTPDAAVSKSGRDTTRVEGLPQHSPGVISRNHEKPKSGCPNRESNPSPPEFNYSIITVLPHAQDRVKDSTNALSDNRSKPKSRLWNREPKSGPVKRQFSQLKAVRINSLSLLQQDRVKDSTNALSDNRSKPKSRLWNREPKSGPVKRQFSQLKALIPLRQPTRSCEARLGHAHTASLTGGDTRRGSNTSPDRGGVVVRPPASHRCEPGSIPGQVAPGFSDGGIVPDDAAGRRIFSGISGFPRLCITALLHARLASPSSALNTSTNCTKMVRDDCVVPMIWYRHPFWKKVSDKFFVSNSTTIINVTGTVHAALREHCTPVKRPARSGDGALVARAGVTLIAPASFARKRRTMMQSGGPLRGMLRRFRSSSAVVALGNAREAANYERLYTTFLTSGFGVLNNPRSPARGRATLIPCVAVLRDL
ncbi:hypothetical protein PR048_022805 [Dryococelus australis]|uniref:Uncharacterized protein n=1 Tax=Dryococelus australis TaxID=614101 RepID=A0ABQ9GS95_9NEOP|nr:hypothetical protein PR048_022805 [Dryococelus australis]